MNPSSSHRQFMVGLLALIVLLSPLMARGDEPPQDRAAWMTEARFGVMTHFLADWIARRENLRDGQMTVEHWNDLVDHFDVEGLADQVKSTGAGIT
jgi:hypothetical protein